MTRVVKSAAATLALTFGLAAVHVDAQRADPAATPDVTAPKIIFSTVPAVVVTVNGDPILRDVAGTTLKRVVNTNALILRDEADAYYLKILDGWMQAYALGSWWEVCDAPPQGANIALRQAAAEPGINLLASTSTPELADRRGVSHGEPPEIYVSTSPTILIVTNGPPQFATVPRTKLEYVTNTTAHIFKEPTDQELYVLTSRGWYRSWRPEGPWQSIDTSDLPRDIGQLPANDISHEVTITR